MSDPTPLDVEAIRARLDATSPSMRVDVHVGASTLRASSETNDRSGFVGAVTDLVDAVVGETGPLRVTFADDEDGADATFALHAATDLRRLLDEVERARRENNLLTIQLHNSKMCALRELEAQIRGDEAEAERDALAATVAALTERSAAYKAELDRVIREAAADKAENARYLRIIDEITADNAGLTACLDAVAGVVPQLRGVFGDGDVRVDTVAKILADALDAAPEMPRPPAVEALGAVEPSGTGSGRGTGVAEAPGTARAGEAWIPSFAGDECPHRPEWTCPEHEECRSCECDCNTYVADLEEPDLTLIPGDMVVRDPGICSGRPTMRGTRILASRIAGELAAGTSWETLREWYPSLPVPGEEA